MILAHREAQRGASLEAPRGREHGDCGRPVRVLGRKDELAMVHAARIRRLGRAVQYVVPLEDVGLRWARGDARRSVQRERLQLLLQPLRGNLRRHVEARPALASRQTPAGDLARPTLALRSPRAASAPGRRGRPRSRQQRRAPPPASTTRAREGAAMPAAARGEGGAAPLWRVRLAQAPAPTRARCAVDAAAVITHITTHPIRPLRSMRGSHPGFFVSRLSK